ncbi:MAG: hypothetical protein RRY47_06160 [Oscillospiraceae bacterium]
MKELQIACERPMPNRCGCKFRGIAFDGCYFYLTNPSLCEIIRLDREFCETACFEVQRPYTSICFDLGRECFWAATDDCCRLIFKLDLQMVETDCITLPGFDKCGGLITGLSSNCENNRLLISFPNCLVELDPDCPRKCRLLQTACSAWNTGVCSVSPCYLLNEAREVTRYISIYDGGGELLCRYETPPGYAVEAMVFCPCTRHCDNRLHFYLLVTKNGCYPYILDWTPDCPELQICHCNFQICNRKCPHEPQDRHACTDIMESIALIEAALSHILNAEGEKLQKVIAVTDDVEEILCVNRAINDTITNVTHLEIILHNKLEAVKGCCFPLCEEGDCGKKP